MLNIRSIWAAKLTFWKLERGQRLCWCDSGLWGWSAGGSSQGDLGWEGTLLLIISQSSSHQGHCWEAGKRQQLGVMVKPAGPRIAQILFLSGCWAAGIELSGYWAAGIELSSIFLFRLLKFNQVRYFLPRLLVFCSRTVLSEYCTLSSIYVSTVYIRILSQLVTWVGAK